MLARVVAVRALRSSTSQQRWRVSSSSRQLLHVLIAVRRRAALVVIQYGVPLSCFVEVGVGRFGAGVVGKANALESFEFGVMNSLHDAAELSDIGEARRSSYVVEV